jgi:hypothetical protein
LPSAFRFEKQKSLICEQKDWIWAGEASPINRHRHFIEMKISQFHSETEKKYPVNPANPIKPN